MRPILLAALCAMSTLACGGDTFTVASGGSSASGRDGGVNGSDASGIGGSQGVGGKSGTGGSSSNGGAAGNGGLGGTGGANAGGASNDGGSNSGGSVGNGGTNVGGTVSTGGLVGTGGVAVDGGATGAGGAPPKNSGDCVVGGGDCHNGTRCVEVTPNGYRVCAEKYSGPTTCAASDECCQTSDCKGGAICYAQPLTPQCGGIVVLGGNVCASDACTSDAACGSSAICAPVGTFKNKVRSCVPASCRFDTDCTQAPSGICSPVSGGCCDNPLGLYCVYPASGCRDNSDCQSQNCEIDQKGASFCDPSPMVCPL